MRIKLIGPPGTGKTETLAKILEYLLGQREDPPLDLEELSELPTDLRPSEICVVSYSRSAVKEFGDRVGISPFGRNSEAKYWRTFHGICVQDLLMKGRIDHDQVYELERLDYHQARFCRKNGYRYSYDPFKRYEGNNMFNEITRRINLEYHEKGLKGILSEVPGALYRFYYKWRKYKREAEIFDYDDILMMSYKNPPSLVGVKVILVDEAQDLTPLQYRILEMISKDRDVILAGDDMQTVYQFTGARAKEFMEWKADRTVVLSRSYRLPERIHALAQEVEKRILRHPRPFSPRNALGVILFGISFENLISKVLKTLERYGDIIQKIFILTRTNALAIKVIGAFLSSGYKVSSIKKASRYTWDQKMNAIASVCRYLRGKSRGFIREDAKTASRFAIGTLRDLLILASKGNYPVAEEIPEEVKRNPLRFFRLENRTEREILEKTLEIETLKDISKYVYVDTIHSAKGMEADFVYVVNAVSKRDKRLEDISDELRLLYVAITRARGAVCLVSPPRNYDPWLPDALSTFQRIWRRFRKGSRRDRGEASRERGLSYDLPRKPSPSPI